MMICEQTVKWKENGEKKALYKCTYNRFYDKDLEIIDCDSIRWQDVSVHAQSLYLMLYKSIIKQTEFRKCTNDRYIPCTI